MNHAYPFSYDAQGRTATADYDDHIRQMIEQVLFTAPGERVNRPTFGCGLLQLVFAGNSETLTATTQFVVQSALTQWLGDVIEVEAVQVDAIDAELRVIVRYTVLATQSRREDAFSRGGDAP